MHAVAYRITGIHEIELILPLREHLIEYHPVKASRCKAYYERMSFEDRRSYFRALGKSLEKTLTLFGMLHPARMKQR